MFDPGPPHITELPPNQEEAALRLCLRGLEQSQFEQQVAVFRASIKR